jgi:hypothetical protein
VVIGTDYTGSCKANYHTTRTTTAPKNELIFLLVRCIIAHT